MFTFRRSAPIPAKLKLPLSVTAIAVMAAQPVLADYWVAVAVNKTVGQHGNSYFLGTKREAVNSALTNCKKFSKGAEGCEVVLVTRRCSGMAHAGRSIYVREGNSANKAGASALKACNANHGNACRIHETFCPNQ